MRKIVFFFLMVLTTTVFSQIQVSDSAKISLITCSPGKAVYEQFGHTAIRYLDSATGADLMFNYGMFNFDKPNFYGKFIKGETYYELGVYNSEYFFPEYKQRNSQVTEQELNLTKEEKQKLMNALLLNYQPENKKYLYNFIFDNCATRPRVKIEETLGTEKVIYSPKHTHYYTFRHWIGNYVGFYSWTKFGIDLLLGKEADRIASKMEATFLPEDLMEEFSEAQVKSADGKIRPLVKSEKILVEKKPEFPIDPHIYQNPSWVTLFILLIGLFVTYFELIKKKNWKIFDSLLLIITGLGGLIIFYLMFFSIHPLVKSNFNILWCNPFNIFVGVILWFRKFRKTTLFFQLANVLLFAGAFIVFLFSIQHINAAAVPFILLLLTRSVFWIFKERNVLRKRA
ncbi:conserved membrane hypothetical protein [uncultured Paludibacter sp.]|nr:conserved membrane hypothetical protein [uncultured Paludibacter sp.]